MKFATSLKLVLVPTLLLFAVRAADIESDGAPTSHVRRRVAGESGTDGDAPPPDMQFMPKPNSTEATEGATSDSTSASFRVWVQFKADASHDTALQSVQSTIVANLGAPEQDAANLLVPDEDKADSDASSAQEQRASDGIGETKYPFKMHYDFFAAAADVPYMVMTVDAITLQALKNDPNVVSVENDVKRFPVHETLTEEDEEMNRQLQKYNITQDADYIPTGIKMANAHRAWALGYKGRGVKVCVIDSGLDLGHPDFPTSWVGWSTEAGPWYTDGTGHGTHVIGTIAARQNGLGVTGVAPAATVMTFRVFNDAGEFVYSSSVANAAYNCYLAGARVINMSLGGGDYSTAENNMFSFLYGKGVVSVASAGNSGTTTLNYPASYAGVVSVAAIDSNWKVASFSNRNNQVDLSAHGVGVISTFPRSQGSFASLSGTSMASPHVAGVAALLLSKRPTATAAKIISAMYSTAKDLGRAGRDTSYGNGAVNAYAALSRV